MESGSGAIAARSSAGGAAGVAPGTLLGGRFEVLGAWAGPAGVGETHRAVDKKTGKGIAIRVLPTGSLPSQAEIDELRAAVKLAATLTHKNVVATFGMGIEPGGLVFVATELVEGRSLRAVLDDRRKAGQAPTFAARGAYNVVAHVCNAAAYAHSKLVHGALCPTTILVSRAGRVKVGDFGLWPALRPAERQRLFAATGQAAYLAPESLGSPGPLPPGADVYSLGVLLFDLLSGRPPGSAAETLGPRFHPELSAIVARAMAPAPADRFESAAELKATLHAAIDRAAAMEPAPADGLDVEIDIEPTGEHRTPSPRTPAGFTAPPEARAPAAPGRPVPPPVAPTRRSPAPADPTPRVGARVPVGEDFRPSLQPQAPAPDRASVVDLGALLGELSAQDAERWMVQKDKLDHGPFAARELVQQIMRGEVLSDHVVVNMDSGERKKLAAWPEFKGFAEEYRVRKAKQDSQEALARTVTSEKRGTAAKFVVIVIVLAVLGAGLAVFFITRQTGGESAQTPDELADLFAAGKIEVTGTAGILPAPRRTYRRGPGGTRPAGIGPRGGGALSYEDAMNQAVDLGNVENSGGEQTLTAGQVAGTMNGNIRRFARCIGVDPSVHNVSMSLAIAGSGQIVGVSVSQGSPAFRQCVASAAQSIRMPPFSAPRMGASYNFSW